MNRQLQQLIPSQETSDGAGVRIKRSIGKHQHARFDPFLMLDEFGSASANDYIAGFPNHPHRGFETVTYMLQGHMLHEDHLGNRGNLQNGDVQWMTAGRGIIHSEMPQQEEGLMRGFQLWLNLPAAEKMKPASYKDIPSAQIPVTELANGGCVKVIANKLTFGDKTISGPIQGCTTEPYYWDVHLPKDGEFAHAIPSTHNVFIYVYEGGVAVGDDARETPKGHAGILSGGDAVSFKALSDDTRFILLAGIPIREPIAQYGPFVMNTPDEIEQAIQDYRSGALINY